MITALTKKTITNDWPAVGFKWTNIVETSAKKSPTVDGGVMITHLKMVMITHLKTVMISTIWFMMTWMVMTMMMTMMMTAIKTMTASTTHPPFVAKYRMPPPMRF